MMRLARRISQYGETEDTDAEAKSFFPLVCLTKVWPAFVLTQNPPPICVLQALATLEAISLLADKRELPVPVLPGEISNCHALNRIDLYRGNRLPSPGCSFAATAQ